VGNADPRALSVATAAAQALDWVGLPEAQYALAQAATYIATAPKSDRSGSAYWAAAGDVEARGSLPVPLHLRTAGDRRMKHHGIGVGYKNPHEFEGADVDQRYLPDELDGKRYYLPTDQGYESTISERMARREAARSAARQTGRTPRSAAPRPEIGRSDPMRKREESRKKLADTEKRDAGT
jgi:putative ATPase